MENSGYRRRLLPGGVVLADRGFNVADSVVYYGAILDVPAFTMDREQLLAEYVKATHKLANVIIHIERIIGAVRQLFQILSATGVTPKEIWPLRKPIELSC